MNPVRMFTAASALLAFSPCLRAQVLCTNGEAELFPSAGSPFDYYGWASAIDGDTAIVGARQESTMRGSVYVFTRSGTSWTYAQRLLASDGEDQDLFSWSVDLDGDTLVIGAIGDDDLGMDAGAAYVFRRNGGVWSEEAKLLASDGAADDNLGEAVAIEGDTIVVGAGWASPPAGAHAGVAYVFTRSGTSWTEQAKLVASDGEAEDLFGSAVAIAGDWISVGARLDDDACALDPFCQSGAVYMFLRSGATWSEVQKLHDLNTTAGDQFGWSVALSDDWLAVGAINADSSVAVGSGAVCVFQRSGTSWSQGSASLPYLKPGDNFGCSLGLEGDLLVVGARLDDTAGSNRGAVYSYVNFGGVWRPTMKLYPCGLYLDAAFGTSADISGDLILVGAPQDVGAAVSSGSAYVYHRPPVMDPTVYCTAKINSCGGLPSIAAAGWPSTGSGSSFVLSVSGVKGGQRGLLMYTDRGRDSLPFEGGTLCLSAAAVKRSVLLFDTSGTPGQCDGMLSIDIREFATGGMGGSPSPILNIPGTLICAQFWGRDAPGNSLLSDALSYLVYP